MTHVQMVNSDGDVWACPEGYVDRAKERGWKRATKSDLEEDATETAPPQRRTTASKPSKK